MLTRSSFKPEYDTRGGGATGNWFTTLPDDLEVMVGGDESGPLDDAMERANAVLTNLDALRKRAGGRLTSNVGHPL